MYISEKATIGENVSLGIGSIIEDDVIIAADVVIGYNVIIRNGVRIGSGCKISDNAVLGKLPAKAVMSAVTQSETTSNLLCLGENVTVGVGCIIYRGAVLSDSVFVGDMASIREDVSIGELTIIGKGVTIENKVTVGRKVKIETEAYITALSIVEDYCFIAPEVTFTNDNFLGRTEERKKYFKGVTLRRGARVGANATILPSVVIGEDALVAAGAVVTRNVSARVVVVGSPARELRAVPAEQLVENQLFYDK